MQGLIYKDVMLFVKGIDRRLLLVVGAVSAFLVYKAGIFAGLIVTFMLANAIAIQNIVCLTADEKVGWKRYQFAMPLNGFLIVSSKYVAVICTVSIGVLGSIALNLFSSIVYQSFDFALWGASVLVAILIPVIWTAICLPFTYWFGLSSAQIMGVVVVLPMVKLLNYFEDGPGFSSFVTCLFSNIAMLFVVTLILFAVSMVISIVGYKRKQIRT